MQEAVDHEDEVHGTLVVNSPPATGQCMEHEDEEDDEYCTKKAKDSDGNVRLTQCKNDGCPNMSSPRTKTCIDCNTKRNAKVRNKKKVVNNRSLKAEKSEHVSTPADQSNIEELRAALKHSENMQTTTKIDCVRQRILPS
jgi:hypothetical protein